MGQAMHQDDFDSERDKMYERLLAELNSGQREPGVANFKRDRLCSYYLKNPRVAKPAITMLRKSEGFLEQNEFDAAVVFSACATELFLKVSLLQPVIHGLVHSEVLAEVVVESTLKRTGVESYQDLLKKIFLYITGLELDGVKRESAKEPLLKEVSDIQRIRNKILHRGAETDRGAATLAVEVCSHAAIKILNPVLFSLGLEARGGKGIQLRKDSSA